MPTPSGQIGLSDVNAELGNSPSAQINMNSAPVRGLAEVPTGAISMSDLQNKSNVRYVTATGGTVTTSGDFKIHTFTSSGTFTVTDAGNPAGSSSVDYQVVAGGGAGGGGNFLFGTNPYASGGGGAGGFRVDFPNPATGGLPVSAQAYPITVGAGGSNPAANVRGGEGNPSVFSSITSAGGGGGGTGYYDPQGESGGSGGGSATSGEFYAGGAGNTPPVSPPQGNNGGTTDAGTPTGGRGAGGGGAGGVGPSTQPSTPENAIAGAPGTASSITGSSVIRAGGGGGGCSQGGGAGPQSPGGGGGGGGGGQEGEAGDANTGGGGGGGGMPGQNAGGTGGSGVVIIRYKFQN